MLNKIKKFFESLKKLDLADYVNYVKPNHLFIRSNKKFIEYFPCLIVHGTTENG